VSSVCYWLFVSPFKHGTPAKSRTCSDTCFLNVHIQQNFKGGELWIGSISTDLN
jgi:hypothetical protein